MGEECYAGKNVVVLGASAKTERKSHQAVALLKEKGYRPLPVNPGLDELLGLRCYATLADVDVAVDTISVYVNAERSSALADDVLAARPRRVIFNPGAENPELAQRCEAAGIEAVEACTLVLLHTRQF